MISSDQTSPAQLPADALVHVTGGGGGATLFDHDTRLGRAGNNLAVAALIGGALVTHPIQSWKALTGR